MTPTLHPLLQPLVESARPIERISDWVERDPNYRGKPDAHMVKLSISVGTLRALSEALRGIGR